MDLETIKEITEAFGQLGIEAKYALIGYIAIAKGSQVAIAAILCVTVYKLVTRIGKFATECGGAELSLRRAAGLKEWTPSTLDAAAEILRQSFRGGTRGK